MIINGQEKNIRGEVLICNDVWDQYYQELQSLYGDRYLQSEIKTKGFVTGRLDADLTTRLQDMVEPADTALFKASDAKDAYAYSPNVEAYEDTINADHHHYALTPAMLWQMNEITETFDPIIRKAIGTPWRVLNVRIWKTPAAIPETVHKGSLAWHDDGMPPDMLKLLIYLTDLSPETGMVEWKVSEDETATLQGPAGSWLLFQNSVVFHRGIPPTKPGTHRTLLEITLTPSAVNNTTVVHGGNNARHPWRFWQTDLP